MREREIVIRLKVPRSPRARWLFSISGVLVTLGAFAYAADFTPFGNGESLTSSKMNANFKDLQDRLAALESPRSTASSPKLLLSNGTTTYSLDGIYCGPTAAQTGLITNGYTGAKGLCETKCGSASAHMCEPQELVRSSALGLAIDQGWFATGLPYPGATGGDCTGWGSNANTNTGLQWSGGGPFGTSTCNLSSPVLCCN
jgi:hypothetical protein